MLFYGYFFKFQIGAKAVFPKCCSGKILQAYVRRSTHLALAGMVIGGDHLVFLPLILDSHPGSQLGRRDHFSLSRRTMPVCRVYWPSLGGRSGGRIGLLSSPRNRSFCELDLSFAGGEVVSRTSVVSDVHVRTPFG